MYAIVENNNIIEYPIFNLQLRFPNISFPSHIDNNNLPLNVVKVIESSPPNYDFRVERISCRELPEFIDGNWVTVFDIHQLDTADVEHLKSQKRDELIDQVKNIRDMRVQTGGFQVSTKWYHSDTFSRTQQLGLLSMGQSMPPGIMWKTMDGSFVEMTPTLASQIFSAGALSDLTIFGYAQSLIETINNSSDPYSIDIHSGWPIIYGE